MKPINLSKSKQIIKKVTSSKIGAKNTKNVLRSKFRNQIKDAARGGCGLQEDVEEAIIDMCIAEGYKDIGYCSCQQCSSDLFYKNKGRLTTAFWDYFLDEDNNNEVICDDCWKSNNFVSCHFCQDDHEIGGDWATEEEYLIVLASKDFVNVKTGLYKVLSYPVYHTAMVSSYCNISEYAVELVCEIPLEDSPFDEPYCEFTYCKRTIDKFIKKYKK